MKTPAMRCLAVDDEPLALRILEDFIGRVPGLELAGAASSAIAAGEMLQHGAVDLIFLDIDMPHLSGVDFVRLTADLPLVVFTTAYPDYALTGYELNAVDYLLKPFSFDRFYRAVARARELFELRRPAAEEPRPEFLMVRVEYATVRIEIGDILFVEGLKDYVKIVTPHKNYVTKSSLKNVEEKLPADRFRRVHRSFIVNLGRVQSFENNHLSIAGHRIPLGNNNREDFLKFLEKNRL